MAKIKMSKEINRDRRRFCGTAAMTIAAAQLNMIGSADAQSRKSESAQLPAAKPGTHTSFASLKQIDAGVLKIGYAETGPSGGFQSFSFMAGPMTFTALSMLLPCLPRRVTG